MYKYYYDHAVDRQFSVLLVRGDSSSPWLPGIGYGPLGDQLFYFFAFQEFCHLFSIRLRFAPAHYRDYPQDMDTSEKRTVTADIVYFQMHLHNMVPEVSAV